MFVVAIERFTSNIIGELVEHIQFHRWGLGIRRPAISETKSSSSFFLKNFVERTMQYIKDRTENFDDYFPCNRKGHCNHFHVKN